MLKTSHGVGNIPNKTPELFSYFLWICWSQKKIKEMWEISNRKNKEIKKEIETQRRERLRVAYLQAQPTRGVPCRLPPPVRRQGRRWARRRGQGRHLHPACVSLLASGMPHPVPCFSSSLEPLCLIHSSFSPSALFPSPWPSSARAGRRCPRSPDLSSPLWDAQEISRDTPVLPASGIEAGAPLRCHRRHLHLRPSKAAGPDSRRSKRPEPTEPPFEPPWASPLIPHVSLSSCTP